MIAGQHWTKSSPLRRSWITACFWLLALVLAALHTWAAIHSDSMNADGIPYLDIGDAYMRGDWQSAVNPVWSPLYSWLLGAIMALARPTMAWEFALVHVVNLALFVLALLSFEFFWRQLDRYRKQGIAENGHGFPDWAWWALGYALFIWMALALINTWAVTPDMLMAALALLAAGLVVRLRMGRDGWRTFVLLGLVLGLAYLSKSIMFPLAFVFLFAALFAPGDLRRAAPRTGVALLVFLLVSLPFIAAISRSHGSVTFGESGTITYLRHVNGIAYPHWQGETGDFGRAAHASRQIFSSPPIYEFGEPIGGTYPISYNPLYWYEGALVQFDVGRQLQAVLSNGLYYFDLFVRQQAGLVAGVLLLYLISAGDPRTPRDRRFRNAGHLLRRWGLLLPALAAFAVYALVYVEGRYVGVFVLLFWSDLLANARLPDSPLSPQIMRAAGMLMVAFLLANIVAFNLEGYGRLEAAGSAALQAPPARPLEVAGALHELGVGPGSAVGVIGYGFDSYWARLARVRIVAEMLDWQADPFWLGNAALQEHALAAFAGSGACAVVAEYAPAYARLSGWHQVGASNYYITLLAEEC